MAEIKAPRRRTKQYAHKQVIFEEGAPGDAAYLIAEGEVEVFRKKGGKEVGIASLQRGDIFGEMSLIDHAPRTATARAIGDVNLIVVTPEDLASRLDHLEQNDKVLRRLIDVFVRRLRGQIDRLV